MKVKVKKEFVDKHTWKIHPFGEVFECTEDRLQEIQSVGDFVSKVEEKPARSRKKVSE
jgi:hypothetical protein